MSTAEQLHTAPDVKRLATAKARAALAGVQLHVIADDAGRPSYVCTRWAMSAYFDGLADVEAWLDRVCGSKA
jgi:hypothetical protein